jgi:alpha-glucosidase
MSDDKSGNIQSRRSFVVGALALPIIAAELPKLLSAAQTSVQSVLSPNRHIRFELLGFDAMQLKYRITRNNIPVIEDSVLGIGIAALHDMMDGVDRMGSRAIRRIGDLKLRETFATRGGHSVGLNYCNGARFSVLTDTNYTLEVRVFNDGVAFQYVIPGDDKLRVPSEKTSFTIPNNSTVWFHDFYGHYEGIHTRKEIAEVKTGEWAAPPLTIKLSNNSGYVAITEAALMNYAGMGLQADGQRGFKLVLGDALPVSYPFELRYGKEEAKRLSQPAAIRGNIKSPWRVVMIAETLNELVNNQIIDAVSPAPDRKLFPLGLDTSWVKPGRSVWKYLDGGDNTLESMKEFSRLAGELGFEYNVVEGFWQKWSEDQMRELANYAKQYKVGTWFWKHSKDLRTPYARRQFFELLNRVGVVGTKIDFFDHEAKEIIDLYQALLREAAEHQIMVEFHGSNKPAGESRTWPNEMTRESIKGMEYSRQTERASHNVTLPFTRFLAGHADYTAMHFGERRKDTSWAHQIASAAIFTSPMLIFAANPKNILANPAVDLIKSIPSVWDETVVLPPSEIGELAAFARRNGNTWFLAIMNGPASQKRIEVPLTFLNRRISEAVVVKDNLDNPAAVEIEKVQVQSRQPLSITMRAGGGFIARFS